MKTLPKIIVRIDDGMEFVLDEKSQTYSLKSCAEYKAKGHLVFEYSYKLLMEDYRGKFVIPTGKEDWNDVRRKYFSQFDDTDGHGDGDYE
jgi:hypothetical protein